MILFTPPHNRANVLLLQPIAHKYKHTSSVVVEERTSARETMSSSQEAGSRPGESASQVEGVWRYAQALVC